MQYPSNSFKIHLLNEMPLKSAYLYLRSSISGSVIRTFVPVFLDLSSLPSFQYFWICYPYLRSSISGSVIPTFVPVFLDLLSLPSFQYFWICYPGISHVGMDTTSTIPAWTLNKNSQAKAIQRTSKEQTYRNS
ncbi:hypothetical protein DPMN_178405 [Dreissena polymorpha]|uniref:Uncharacterized protein n=1 Tax=Dreissena polymorpha TaxID=45954 RepID=A0A9D4EC15_DREPO|nr:hypothetical protein DPMN_178405 [Dreissena polymorpha]